MKFARHFFALTLASLSAGTTLRAQPAGQHPLLPPVGAVDMILPEETPPGFSQPSREMRRPQVRGGYFESIATAAPRRWQSVAGWGEQPATFTKADLGLRASLGVQTTLLGTDNINFERLGQRRAETLLETSALIKVSLGDSQGWIPGIGSNLSGNHLQLLYVPTLFQQLGDGRSITAHHFLGEWGHTTATWRSLLRVDYDQRLLISSENTSPEDNFTMLDASLMGESKINPKNTLRAKGTLRRIELPNGLSARNHWIGEMVWFYELSPKTRFGPGAELGFVDFEQSQLGHQNYQQAQLWGEWRPTEKLSFSSTLGLETRAIRSGAQSDHLRRLVGQWFMSWQASDKTRLSLRARLNQDPSVIAQGATARTLRVGPEFQHEFSEHFYSTFDATLMRRRYLGLDQPRLDIEPLCRLAMGWRAQQDRRLNRTNLELFYQWHHRDRSDDPADDRFRTQAGLQLTHQF